MDEADRPDDVTEASERAGDTVEDLERRREQLDETLDDAEKARARAHEDQLIADAAGDWEDTEGGGGQGDDPKGAVDDEPAEDR